MSPHKTRRLRIRDPRSHRMDGLWVLMPGWFLVQAGLAAFFQPEAAKQTTVAQILDPRLELLWQVAYMIAGVLMIVGVLVPRPTAEVVGHWLGCWALVVNIFALLVVRGVAGAGVTPAAYAVTILALAVRIRTLHRLPAEQARAKARL